MRVSSDIKCFLANFFSLSLLRGFDRISPLITTPFLMRTIGLELYGVLAFTKAFCYYFSIFTQYGFPYSATREISLSRDNRSEYSEIFCAVQFIKLLVLFISAISLLFFTSYIPTCRTYASYLWLYFPVIASSTLFPIWLFQGMEKMGLMTALNLVQKFLFLLWMFLYLRSPEQFTMYLAVIGAFEMLRLLLALIVVQKKWSIIWKIPSREAIERQLKAGWHLFLSNLSINSYARLPTVFLGFYAGPAAVGIYALGVRISRSLLGLLDPLIQAYFPLASRIVSRDPKAGVAAILRFLKTSIGIYTLIGLSLFICAEPLTLWLAAKPEPTVTLIMRLVAFLPLITVVSNILGIELLVNLGFSSCYSGVMIATVFVCALSLALFTPYLGALGAAGAVVTAEIFATTAMVIFAKRALRRPYPIP